MKEYKSTQGFDLVSADRLEEYQADGLRFIHKKTGCEIYHVRNNDSENLFAFIFYTPPEDNCGTAHIIEHSVLAGSEHLPVKYPFLQLLKSSVYTFLNAMTFPDRTLYPASSTVEKDYFNLMKVYGDAVFFPLLRKETFWQEGIRYEKDRSGKLEKQGVVYNEMKGSYSEQSSILDEYSCRSLFPDTAFRFDSGGEPEHIPELTYQQFAAFHKRYYHPSNCRIFLYGNIDTEKQLRFLNREFLNGFSAGEKIASVPMQKKYDKHFYLSRSFPSGESDTKKGSAAISWLCGDSSDIHYVLKSKIISKVLFDDPSSLLYRRIIDSKIAEDISSVTGVSSYIRQTLYCVGIRGLEKGKTDDFENLVFSGLRDIASENIDHDFIEAALNRLDFHSRELKSGFGLVLLQRMIPGWIYRDSPDATLCRIDAVEKLKKEYAENSSLFNDFIKKEFLENPHYSVVSLFPEEEKKERESETAALTAEIEENIEQFEKYKKSKDSDADIAKIPVLEKSDIPLELKAPDFVKEERNGSVWYFNKIFTGGIVYIDIFFDIDKLDEKYLPYIPLFCSVLEESSLPGIPYYDVAARLDILAGQWSVSEMCEADITGHAQKNILVRFAAMENRAEEAARFMSRLLKEGEVFDPERIKAVVHRMRNDLKEIIIEDGSGIAELQASGMVSETSRVCSLWEGIPQFFFLENIDTDDKAAIDKIADTLLFLRDTVFGLCGKTVNIVSGAGYDEKGVISFIDESFPSCRKNISAAAASDFIPLSGTDCFITGSLVNHTALALPWNGIEGSEYIPEAALAHILTTGYLWEKVRMEGGAYGVSASSNMTEHIFCFSSYRDPNIESTFDFFKKSLVHIASGDLSEETLSNAVINLSGNELRPFAPGRKGLIDCIRDMRGITWELRKKRRQLLLNLSAGDIISAAERLSGCFSLSAASVIAGKECAEKESGFLNKRNCRKINIPV